MLIVNLIEEENGARQNQLINGAMGDIPEGWAAIPEEFYGEAMGYLPWLGITVSPEGQVTGVFENSRRKQEFMNEGEEN